MVEHARTAAAGDLNAIHQLVASALVEAADKRGGALLVGGELAGVADRVAAILAAEPVDDQLSTGAVVVGTFDDVVLGVASVLYEDRPAGRQARLEAFVVDPGARSVAIGEAMMRLVQDQARAQGCIGLDAYALPGDRDTKNFFESFGLKARLLVVHTDL